MKMSNPAYGLMSPRQARIVRGNSQSADVVDVRRGTSKFNLSNTVYCSGRFGEVRPFFCERGVAGDKFQLRSVHELWSNQLKSPLMSDLTMYKDFFYIPYKALMPNTWDLFKNVPVQGDDVPEDVYMNFDIGTFILALFTFTKSLSISSLSDSIKSNTNNRDNAAYLGFLNLALIYHTFSSNSLLTQLGINTGFYVNSGLSGELLPIDEGLERIFSGFSDSTLNSGYVQFINDRNITGINSNGDPYRIIERSGNVGVINVSELRRFLSDFVSYGFPKIHVDINNTSSVETSYPDIIYRIFESSTLHSYIVDNFKSSIVDISPLYAYQAVCSQFFVNDSVDKIFTFSSWMDNLKSIFESFSSTGFTFDYNGSSYYYDILSTRCTFHVLSLFFNYIENETIESIISSVIDTDSLFYRFYSFFSNIFFPQESLRFLDYFTGSRLNPLAIGSDINAVVSVNDNKVSAIDITKSIAWQSFLNDIQKLGPTSWIQQRGIFGETPSTLSPMPRSISRESCPIGSMQIENNSNENQGNIVSRFRSESGQYMFNIDLDEDCIILGLFSFDIPRVYSNKVSRFAFTYDRNDFFNPYFQNIGDQEVYLAENFLFAFGPDDLTYSYNSSNGTIDFTSNVFGWQIRDTQYKQRYNVASGAFVGDLFLPSWAFVKHENFYQTLSPTYIRNHNTEFDKYFVSLPNFSNAGYYHFYMRFRNICTAYRKMQKRPGIQMPRFHQ